jgi:putative MATE family efflux protein
MYLESILRTTLTSADVWMLNHYSQSAVAAVGLINNISFFIMIMYMVISMGSSVLISQNLGAGREKEAGQTALAAFILVSAFSLVISLAMGLGAGGLLRLLYRELEADVRRYAWQYLAITGSCSIFVAYNITQASVLRAYGHTKDAMWSNMAANALNVVGNAIAIYGPFGLPKTGVAGVAVSTVVSQAAACLILSWRIRRLKEIRIPWRAFREIPRQTYRGIIAIGGPTAGENLSYQIGQIIVSTFLARLGTAAVAANTNAITLLRFVFMPAMNIGNAGQIKTGYLVGAGRFAEAKRNVFRYYGIAMAFSLGLMAGLFLTQAPIIRIFTKDQTILAMVSTIFLISFARELGRVANIVVIPGLKGAGDAVFPVVIGMLFMWGIGVGGAYLMAFGLGWGMAGIWIATAADEILRGIIMLFRWQSGAWTKKALVKAEAA